MNVLYSWLKEYVDFDLSPEELAAALTSVGLEVDGVEEVQSIKGGLKGIVVGQVLTCEAHPNSDHLHITTVDFGAQTPSQIVCGAPNVAAGQKVLVATLGAVIYSGDDSFTIKPSKLRGVESFGMLCSGAELGLNQDNSGIMVLPSDAPVGTPAATYFNLESDYVIEVDITPNHADACSHWGVARDLYAWLRQNGYKTALHKPLVDAFKVQNNDLKIDVQVENTQACPRYAGVSIKGVTVNESPEWLKRKLNAIGLRPINNIVDITNFIVHAVGQPLHCFDADKIKGGKIVVKTMPQDTKFVTLDGTERKLSDRDLMICNANEAMCIAGVFGGLDSGTTEETKNVFLESAYFDPTWVRKTARRHQLSTDASFRFERGIDPNGVIFSLKYAALLVQELAGGEISMEIEDNYPNPIQNFSVDYNFESANRLIGKNIPDDTVKSIITDLGIEIVEESATDLKLSVPPFRVDVQRQCDVVEEVLRIYGYNNVEFGQTFQASLSEQGAADRSNKMQNLIAGQLIGSGFSEILNNSLTRAAYYEGLESYPTDKLVRIMNPLSSDLNVMRQTLLFGGLESVSHNIRRQAANLAMFEFGKCYYFNAAIKADSADVTERDKEHSRLRAYTEDMHLGLWLTGNMVQSSWAHADQTTSVYQLKAYVENIFERLGLENGMYSIEEQGADIYSSALSYVLRSGKAVAQIGVVKNGLLKASDVDAAVYYADINWDVLMKATRKVSVSYTELPKFPEVRRDLALLVDVNVTFQQIRQTALKADSKLIKSISLFDVYQGKNLEPGKKSYAVCFMLQDPDATLNDKVIEKCMNKVVAALQKELGAVLR
ncbi:MAG: phenylalanine--tRNA ligase subunit beta [Bacteroidaceae bacterium]|nr:phenylalanine--tRNA ligase subunit beta [Bacteroidaceae bacterium]